MSAAFVPTFTRHLTLHGKEDAWRLGNNVVTTLLLVTHDQRVADVAERVVRMQDGRIVGSTIAAPAVRAVGG